MNVLKTVFIFAAGAALGSAVTYKVVKTKFERIAQEEIDSVKEAFLQDKKDNEEEAEEAEPHTFSEEDKEEYTELIKKYNKSDENEVQARVVDKPYIIRPDEYDELDYETVSLIYYADGILTDDMDNIIDEDDIEDMIGVDSLNHFGEFEDDSVFVRNDVTKTDYEILKDLDVYPYNDLPDSED